MARAFYGEPANYACHGSFVRWSLRRAPAGSVRTPSQLARGESNAALGATPCEERTPRRIGHGWRRRPSTGRDVSAGAPLKHGAADPSRRAGAAEVPDEPEDPLAA